MFWSASHTLMNHLQNNRPWAEHRKCESYEAYLVAASLFNTLLTNVCTIPNQVWRVWNHAQFCVRTQNNRGLFVFRTFVFKKRNKNITWSISTNDMIVFFHKIITHVLKSNITCKLKSISKQLFDVRPTAYKDYIKECVTCICM